jgi:hypothetical protein
MVATRRKAAGAWVALCFVIFLLMFNAPVQGARAPEGYWYQCPSLPTIIRLGAHSDAEERRLAGIQDTPAYIACRTDPALQWAAASVVLPTLLCLGGFVFVARAGARARPPQ